MEPWSKERLEGGIWGLLVGDALGVPYEFHPPEAIPAAHLVEMAPPSSFPRTYAHVPPGTWSDDGAQALCLLASLLYRDQVDAEDLMRRMLNWLDFGYLAVDGKVFDVGSQTSLSLAAFRDGTPPLRCGGTDERSNGNGSLMRVLPLALWHRGSDAELVADARLQSTPTHAHLRSQLCCGLYCLWARRILENAPDAFAAACTALRSMFAADSKEAAELEVEILPLLEKRPRGTGYVVDSLASARWALDLGDYEKVVRGAISLGNDTDTTACIAGGLAGLRDGVAAIPRRWLDGLRDAAAARKLVDRLLESAASLAEPHP